MSANTNKQQETMHGQNTQEPQHINISSECALDVDQHSNPGPEVFYKGKSIGRLPAPPPNAGPNWAKKKKDMMKNRARQRELRGSQAQKREVPTQQSGTGVPQPDSTSGPGAEEEEEEDCGGYFSDEYILKRDAALANIAGLMAKNTGTRNEQIAALGTITQSLFDVFHAAENEAERIHMEKFRFVKQQRDVLFKIAESNAKFVKEDDEREKSFQEHCRKMKEVYDAEQAEKNRAWDIVEDPYAFTTEDEMLERFDEYTKQGRLFAKRMESFAAGMEKNVDSMDYQVLVLVMRESVENMEARRRTKLSES